MQEKDLSDKQNPYLTRLDILPEVQALFYGAYKTDHKSGGIYFEYGDGLIEHYSLGFHRVPSVPTFWKAGVLESNITTDIIIGFSVMDIITYFSKRINTYSKNANILFLACGSRLYDSHLALIKTLDKKRITLIFDNSFLGSVGDIKVASVLLNQPIAFKVIGDTVTIDFKGKKVDFPTESLSLDGFRRAFKVRIPLLKTQKSKNVNFLRDFLIN